MFVNYQKIIKHIKDDNYLYKVNFTINGQPDEKVNRSYVSSTFSV